MGYRTLPSYRTYPYYGTTPNDHRLSDYLFSPCCQTLLISLLSDIACSTSKASYRTKDSFSFLLLSCITNAIIHWYDTLNSNSKGERNDNQTDRNRNRSGYRNHRCCEHDRNVPERYSITDIYHELLEYRTINERGDKMKMWETITWHKDGRCSRELHDSRSLAYEFANNSVTDNITSIEIYGPNNEYDSCQY